MKSKWKTNTKLSLASPSVSLLSVLTYTYIQRSAIFLPPHQNWAVWTARMPQGRMLSLTTQRRHKQSLTLTCRCMYSAQLLDGYSIIKNNVDIVKHQFFWLRRIWSWRWYFSAVKKKHSQGFTVLGYFKFLRVSNDGNVGISDKLNTTLRWSFVSQTLSLS